MWKKHYPLYLVLGYALGALARDIYEARRRRQEQHEHDIRANWLAAGIVKEKISRGDYALGDIDQAMNDFDFYRLTNYDDL